MYVLKPGVKSDPHRRWALPDRIFFGHGACHILAGVYLRRPPLSGFWAEKITPGRQLPGNHIYLTNGHLAFDYHGYSQRSRLLAHHAKVWSAQHADWACQLDRVDFDLLDTVDLNQRQMRGPDQYLSDPIPRASVFINRIDHVVAARRAENLLGNG